MVGKLRDFSGGGRGHFGYESTEHRPNDKNFESTTAGIGTTNQQTFDDWTFSITNRYGFQAITS